MDYLDFDLAIEPSAAGYLAKVINSPAGQATTEFQLPFSEIEFENFLLRVGRTRRVTRRVDSPEVEFTKAFGGQLFSGVFSGDVRNCLRNSLDEASEREVGLRIRLHLSKAPMLSDLPWEFLYNPTTNRFFSLSVETPIVRYLELPERIRPLNVKPPLRILMMISSPTDYPKLDVSRETEKMMESLHDLKSQGLVSVDLLEDATLAQLQRRLQRNEYHIFHFLGHGEFNHHAQDGVLVLEDEQEKGRRVSAQFLGTLLHDHRPLRLAVLNACEGARTSRSDPFAGTAQSLVQQGIPAVIAMQFEVSDESAICFTHAFYAAVAVGYPVDAALAEARKAIFAGVSEIEWGTPVLYMRSPDARIFDVAKLSEEVRRHHQAELLLSEAVIAAESSELRIAEEKTRRALELDPDNVAAKTRLSDLSLRRQVSNLFDEGKRHFNAQRWADAIEFFRRVETLKPGFEDCTERLSAAEHELGKLGATAARSTHPQLVERWDPPQKGSGAVEDAIKYRAPGPFSAPGDRDGVDVRVRPKSGWPWNSDTRWARPGRAAILVGGSLVVAVLASVAGLSYRGQSIAVTPNDAHPAQASHAVQPNQPHESNSANAAGSGEPSVTKRTESGANSGAELKQDLQPPLVDQRKPKARKPSNVVPPRNDALLQQPPVAAVIPAASVAANPAAMSVAPEDIRREVQDALVVADRARASAHRTLTASGLDRAVRGEELHQIKMYIGSMSTQGIYEVDERTLPTLGSVMVSGDQSTAAAQYTQSRTSKWFTLFTNNCVKKAAPYVTQNRATLRRAGNQWLVERVDSRGSGPAAIGCQ